MLQEANGGPLCGACSSGCLLGLPRHGEVDVSMLDDIRQDFNAHGRKCSAQGFWVMIVYRFGRWRYGVRPAVVRKIFSFAYKILFKLVQILTGVELPCEAEVGRNFVI